MSVTKSLAQVSGPGGFFVAAGIYFKLFWPYLAGLIVLLAAWLLVRRGKEKI